MSSVLSKSPCSSHRAAKTFEALGTRLIFVLGFLVSTETNISFFDNGKEQLCIGIFVLIFISHSVLIIMIRFTGEVNLPMRQIFNTLATLLLSLHSL